MKIGVTGHRPEKLIGGWKAYEQNGIGAFAFIETLRAYFDMLGATTVVSGMAVGFDTMAALATGWNNERNTYIKLHAYVPFEGHHKRWQKYEQETLQFLLDLPYCTKYVPDFKPTTYQEVCMMLNKRNQDIVDSGIEVLVALWNGTPGGTGNCVKYAQKQGVTVLNVWDVYEWFMNKKLKEQ